jgi:hypothetical protein
MPTWRRLQVTAGSAPASPAWIGGSKTGRERSAVAEHPSPTLRLVRKLGPKAPYWAGAARNPYFCRIAWPSEDMTKSMNAWPSVLASLALTIAIG